MAGILRSLALARRAVLALALAAVLAPAQAAEGERLFSFETLSRRVPGGAALADAPYEAKAAATAAAVAAVLPDLLARVGLDPARVRLDVAPGGYLQRTNPSVQLWAATGAAQTLRLAAALGYVFRQGSVLVWNFDDAPLDGAAWSRAASVTVEVAGLERDRAALAAGFFAHAAAVHAGLGGGFSTVDGALVFLNLRDEAGRPYSRLGDGSFAAWLTRAAARFADAPARVIDRGFVRVRLVGNDWAESPGGEAYVRHFADRSAAFDDLLDRHLRLLADLAGWSVPRAAD